jgi:MFS family permease
LISAAIAPCLGICVDKVGKRGILVVISSLLVVVSCLLTAYLIRLNYTSENYTCLIPLILLGLAYSIYASSLWPSIPLVVKPFMLGTAFGLVTSVQQIGLTIAPYVVGVLLHDSMSAEYPHYGFVNEQLFLASLAFLGFLCNIWLYYDDKHKRGGMINKV